MDNLHELSSFVKKVLITEKNNLEEVEVTIAIDIKEILEESNKLNILLQVDGQDFKEIQIRRR